ncbi:MAG: carbon-nitrogen hydrolase family protein [Hungatella sp.]|nr:carbon-nitrogen hydrolase family protein [Hungatella sp.]
MNNLLKVALLQLLPEKNLSGQLKKGISACRQAKDMGADIALFPEMWSDGYEIPQDAGQLSSLAIDSSGDFIHAFGQLAADLDMAIAVTFLEKTDSKPKNSVVLFDRHGVRRLHYAKVHTCDFGDERMLLAGDDFFVTDLDTANGNVKIGCMICYDREFPESARILMLKGAEVILVPNACPMEINRLSQLRARAYENMTAIATCNYPGGKPDCNGHSSVFDGVAYHRHESGSRDMEILEASEEEGIYMAEIDMEALREYRSREVHGNAYRRPKKYGLITSEESYFSPHSESRR